MSRFVIFKELICKNIIIDHKAGEIISLVASVPPSVHTGMEWSILILGLAKYSKRSSETQVSYTLKTSQSVHLKEQSKWLGVQNGCCFDR